MGSLTLAKTIADDPDHHSIDQMRGAMDRLEQTRRNGGVRNSERAMARLERRLGRLAAAIERREGGDYRTLSGVAETQLREMRASAARANNYGIW